MQEDLSNREITKIKTQEIKKLYLLCLKRIKFDVKLSDLNASSLSHKVNQPL
jgi:hypothetical protein